MITSRHWSEKWVGVPYAEGNCLEFVARVLREEFGVDKKLPASHEHERLCAEIFNDREAYAVRLPEGAELTDGTVVALRPGAAVMHVGVVVVLTEVHILHNSAGHGSSVLQPLRLVRRLMKVEGFYDARN
jgi:hypothetical protein